MPLQTAQSILAMADHACNLAMMKPSIRARAGSLLECLNKNACNNGAKACTALQVPWEGPKWEVVAACFSLKGGRSDFLVEKAAELGAFALRPILTVRSPYLGQPPSTMPCHSMCTNLIFFVSLAMRLQRQAI